MKISPLLQRLRSREGRALALLLTGAALALGGCASEPESHVVSAAPPPAPVNTVASSTGVMVQTPVVTDPATGAMVAAQPVVIAQAPPALQTEPVLEQPSPKHVWIPGYWSYRNTRYAWIAGRWELPPRSDATWVAPHYEREANAYRFYEGYWK